MVEKPVPVNVTVVPLAPDVGENAVSVSTGGGGGGAGSSLSLLHEKINKPIMARVEIVFIRVLIRVNCGVEIIHRK